MILFQFSAGSFVGVTIWEYEKIRSQAVTVMRNTASWLRKKPREKVQSELDIEINRLKTNIETIWNKFTPGEKIFVPIFLLNALVYGLWRVPAIKPFMLRYFCSNPAAKAVCWPMFLSTFSHYSLFHLFANMYVLHSFSASANSLGMEQFLGLYLSAGVISSFASYAFKIATANPGYSLGAVSIDNFPWWTFFSELLFPTVWRDHGDFGLRLRSFPRNQAINSLLTSASILSRHGNPSDHGVRPGGNSFQMEDVWSRSSFRWCRCWSVLELCRTTAYMAA